MNTPFPATASRLGLYPVVDSVEWIARLLEVGVRTIQLRIKDREEEAVEPAVIDCARQALPCPSVYQRLLAVGN